MERLSENDFQTVNELIRKVAPSNPVLLNPYVKTDGPYKPLLKVGNVRSVKMAKDARMFEFDSPCYVRRIDFLSEDVARLKGFLVVLVIGMGGEKKKIEPQVIDVSGSDGVVSQLLRYSVDGVCLAVQVSLELSFRAVRATRFSAYGYTLNQLEGASRRISETLSLVQRVDRYVEEKREIAADAEERVEQAESRLQELAGEVSALEMEKTSLEGAVDVLKKEVESANEVKKSVSKNVAEAQSRLELARNNEIQLRQTVDVLNREISDKQRDLRGLANDRSLISDEFKDYVKEGRNQSWLYAAFLFCCVGIIAYCSWQLYVGANKILVAQVASTTELAGLILQRLPFAAAISLIITAAWKLSQMFVNRIMKIHGQRLGLARLLVVAKDTVYSSMDGLDVPDEQKFKERIRLKLVMLKSHLTSELGSDFDYVPEPARRTPDSEPASASKDEGDEGDE